MLRLEGLACGYGSLTAVHGLDLEVADGTVVALVGANGAGKTSTVMAVAGHVTIQAGRVRLDDLDLTGRPATARVRAGIALVPEGRRLFPDLSVEENLVVGGYALPTRRAGRNRARVLELFPHLGERRRQRAGSLSGGEQQMLAIGRALMAEPRLLLVDEVSLGLSPKMVDRCFAALGRLRAEGLTVLLVEQHTARALALADRVCVLESGRVVFQGTGAEARRDPALIDAYLGMGAGSRPETPP
jgi:branched-chain amino acid transport system ATP-binding protein